MAERQASISSLNQIARRFPRVSYGETLDFFVDLDTAMARHGVGLIRECVETEWPPLRSTLSSVDAAFRAFEVPRFEIAVRNEAREFINATGRLLFLSIPTAQRLWYANADGVDGHSDFRAWLEGSRAKLHKNPQAQQPGAWRALWSLEMDIFFGRLGKVPDCVLRADAGEMVAGLRDLFEPFEYNRLGLENVLSGLSKGLQPMLISSIAEIELNNFRLRQALLERLVQKLAWLLSMGEGADAMRLHAAPFVRLAP